MVLMISELHRLRNSHTKEMTTVSVCASVSQNLLVLHTYLSVCLSIRP